MSEGLAPHIAQFVQNFVAESAQGLHIDGFGPDDPPAPPLPENFRVREIRNDHDSDLPPSPLVPPTIRPGRVIGVNGPPANQETDWKSHTAPQNAEIMVLDRAASYRGQMVELSATEQAAVSGIVLRAIHARIKAQISELGDRHSLISRKTLPDPADSAPKRRGRPKGIKNKPKEA